MPPQIAYFATITVDDTKPAGQQISVDPPTLETAPDKHVVFVVINRGNRKHKVSVHRDKFEKKGDAPADAPDTPIRFIGNFSEHVEPKDVATLNLRVKDKDDFGGEPGGRYYKYKYTVEASELDDLDPDIGINN